MDEEILNNITAMNKKITEQQAEIDKYKSALKAVRKSYKEKMHVNIDDIDELLNN